MKWVYRFLCSLCLASYWTFYAHDISWHLPVTALFVFLLGLASDAGAAIFIVLYPVVLYLNQYPQQAFSTATFLAACLGLGLSFRKPGRLWLPLSIVFFYFCLSVIRYQQDWPSTLHGAWTTEQTSLTLFAGTFVMWAAGIMLFDYLRQMNPRWLYYALIAQGAVFAAMTVGNIWLRSKQVVAYQFLFGDVNAFGTYLVLQIGLLVGLWRDRRSVARWTAATILFVIDSLLIVASWSRSSLLGYFGLIFLCISVLASTWIRRQKWQRIISLAVVLLVITGFVAAHGVSWSVTKVDNLYRTLEPMAPSVFRHGFITRFDALHTQFSTRIRLITPEAAYAQRIRDWDVPLTVIGDYPVLGIGLGAFYRNSRAYAKRAPQDYLIFYFSENAHNYYLQIAAEAGLTGLALFLAFLAWLFLKHLRLSDPVKLGAGSALVGLMILCVAQHPLLVDRVFFVFVMICAAMAGGDENTETSPAESPAIQPETDRLPQPAT